MALDTEHDHIFFFRDDRQQIFAVKKNENGHYYIYLWHPKGKVFSSIRQVSEVDVAEYRKREIIGPEHDELMRYVK